VFGMQFNQKILQFNLRKLGFVSTFSNQYQLTTPHFTATFTFNNTNFTVRVSFTHQSVTAISTWTKIFSTFRYKVENGLNGVDVSLQYSGTGYRDLLRVLENMQTYL
jgi:hypothetical protein